jgi:hypothetical protein
MNETLDRAQAYSFDVDANTSDAAIRLGRHRFKAHVTEYSWAGYTVIVSAATARKMRKGTHATLEFQGSNYKVCCMESQTIDKKSVEVRLTLDASESAPPVPRKKKRCAASATLNLNQRDPILGIAAATGLVFLLAMAPGWGDGWGTSQVISGGFQAVFTGVYDVCAGIVGG